MKVVWSLGNGAQSFPFHLRYIRLQIHFVINIGVGEGE